MTTQLRSIIAACAILTGTITLVQADGPDERCVGYIGDVRGVAYWAKQPGSIPVRLDPKKDHGRALHAGERVRLDTGGHLKLVLYDKTTELSGPIGWYPIPVIHRGAPDKRMLALASYARIAGGERASGHAIFLPAPNCQVLPDTFEIRWKVAKAGPRTSSIIIQDADGKVLWRQEDADLAGGCLVSDSARKSLSEYRMSGGAGNLVIAFTDPAAREPGLSFSVVSATDAARMNGELAAWDKEPEELLRRLGRAEAYMSYRMFAEAASEYEAGLRLAPESEELLRATIASFERIGDTDHVAVLKRRLAAASARAVPRR